MTASAPKEVSTGAFLFLNDFQNLVSNQTLSAEEVANFINTEQSFYNRLPTYEPSLDPCVLKAQQAVQVQAALHQLTVDLNANLTECEQSKPGLPYETLQAFIHRAYLELTCPDTDLSHFNGMTYTDLLAAKVPLCKGPTKMLYNYEELINATDSDGDTYAYSEKDVILGENGGSCESVQQAQAQAAGLLASEGCLHLMSYRLDSKGVTTADLMRLQAQHLVAGAADPYFTSGTMAFKIDNWSGTMSYSGPQAVPVWSATAPGLPPLKKSFVYQPYGNWEDTDDPEAAPPAKTASGPPPASVHPSIPSKQSPTGQQTRGT